jgi:hypothetical protein
MTKMTGLPLGDYVSRFSVDPAVAERGLRMVWPILEKAELLNYERPRGARFDPSDFKEAVFNATGKRVLDVQTLYQRNVFDCSDPAIRYGGQVTYNDSLAIALYNANWQRIKERLIATYGYEDYNDVHDGLWERIKEEVAQPLGFQYWDNPFDGAISTGGESLFTAMRYVLLSAMVGDEETIKRLDGMLRLVAKWIPIGEIGGKPGRWLAVASAV